MKPKQLSLNEQKFYEQIWASLILFLGCYTAASIFRTELLTNVKAL
jgi:hypothetical protein